MIRHEKEEIRLTKEDPAAVRPVSRHGAWLAFSIGSPTGKQRLGTDFRSAILGLNRSWSCQQHS